MPETQEARVQSLSWGDPRGGNSNPLQCSCLKNPMDRGAWQAAVHGVAKSRTRLSEQTTTFAETLIPEGSALNQQT